MNSKPGSSLHLPAHYGRHRTINLRKDRRFNLWVQAISLCGVLAAVSVAVILKLPLGSTWNPWFGVPTTILAALVYLAAHEVTHGIALQWLTGDRPTYALRFPFLTTGNRAYLDRGGTVLVALAPSVLWGVLLLGALLLAPADLRMTLYVILTLNIAGSAGDYAETVVALRQPPEALIRDDGTEITVFLPSGEGSSREDQAGAASRRPQ